MATLEKDPPSITHTGNPPEIKKRRSVLPENFAVGTSPIAWRVRGRRALAKMKAHKTISLIALVVLIGISAFVVKKLSGKAAAPANAAVPVTVQTLAMKNVRLWSDFSGRLQAVNFAEIRPEVGGRVTEVRFQDGQMVKKDDVLYVIDPAPYRAALEKAQANARFAKTELGRAQSLVKAQAIAQRVFDERVNASRAANADLARAAIDYDRAYVKAPIAGRVSRAEITVGNVVQTVPAAPLLTSIVSNDGIYADFEVDEQTYLQSIREQGVAPDKTTAIPVELTLPADPTHVYKGTISSFDNRIDTISGTIRARARFANEDGVLMPGMFVSIKVGGSTEQPVLLLPERAVSVDQNKKFVYVVDKGNKVAYREVTLGRQVGNDRVAISGVQPGDRVIVDGIQHVHPDVIAIPTEAAPTPPAPNPQTPAPAPAPAPAK